MRGGAKLVDGFLDSVDSLQKAWDITRSKAQIPFKSGQQKIFLTGVQSKVRKKWSELVFFNTQEKKKRKRKKRDIIRIISIHISCIYYLLFIYYLILFYYLYCIWCIFNASIPYNQVAPMRKENVICQVLEGVREIGIML